MAISEIFSVPVTSANRAGITGIMIPMPIESKTTVVKITSMGSFEFLVIMNYDLGKRLLTLSLSK
jgi:hypothetical protein